MKSIKYAVPLPKRVCLAFILVACLAFCFLLVHSPLTWAQTSHISIYGTVHDALSLATINNALVRITSAAGGFDESATSDAYGRYVISNAPTGTDLRVTCRKTGYKRYSSVIAAISISTTTTAYVYDIPLRGLTEGDIGYEGHYPEGCYIYEPGKHAETGYTPGVNAAEFGKRDESDKDNPGDNRIAGSASLESDVGGIDDGSSVTKEVNTAGAGVTDVGADVDGDVGAGGGGGQLGENVAVGPADSDTGEGAGNVDEGLRLLEKLRETGRIPTEEGNAVIGDRQLPLGQVQKQKSPDRTHAQSPKKLSRQTAPKPPKVAKKTPSQAKKPLLRLQWLILLIVIVVVGLWLMLAKKRQKKE